MYSFLAQTQEKKTHPEKNWVCGESVHGECKNVHFEDCDKDILITVKNEDINGTSVGGVFETSGAIKILPAFGKKVRIVPAVEGSCHTDSHNRDISNKSSHRSTVLGKGKEKEEDLETGEKENLIIFPNPATNELTIQITETIVNYKVANTYGVIHLKGTVLTNNKLSLVSLAKGFYFITIQTETETITKIFNKI